MTEIELYGVKLAEAMQDKNPVLMLRRIRNNAISAIALADANSFLTEAAKYNTDLTVTKRVITTANESKHIERILSYMCLQKLSELYKHTYAYKTGLLSEQCTVIAELDKISTQKLISLSKFIHEQALPLMRALLRTNKRMNKQHIMREMLAVLDKVG